MRRLLITGAAGFIGRFAIPELQKGNFEIHAISSRAHSTETGGVTWHQLDLLDTAMARDKVAEIAPEILLHLAWYTEHGLYWSSPDNLRWVEASLSLIRAFADANGKRALFVGSCAEYDWRYGYFTENLTPRAPTTLYGISKNSLFEIANKFAILNGISFAWGRIFFPYGPGEADTRLVSSIIRSLARSEEAKCSHGNQLRDFLYIKDLVSALRAVLESDLTGPVNLASGKPVSLKSIITRIADRLKRSDLVRFGSIPAPGDPPMILADISRLTTMTGWKPAYSLDQGLQEMIDTMQEKL
jgi:nucleoside-diphosphate-sugar epimerase